MPISKVGVKIGDVKFNSNDVHFSLNTGRDSTGLPVLHNLQTTVTVQVDMHDPENLPFDKLKALFERAKLPTGKNITDMEINFWSDDGGNDIVCSYHFKGWLARFETFTAGGVNGVLALELCPVINAQTGANVTMDRESS